MLLRAATLEDVRLSMSSLAILARSSAQILARYHEWYSTQNYNLAWQHLRQITTCAHVTLICYCRQELLKRETEATLASAIWILGLAEPRWTTFAQSTREKLGLVADALGESLCGTRTDGIFLDLRRASTQNRTPSKRSIPARQYG